MEAIDGESSPDSIENLTSSVWLKTEEVATRLRIPESTLRLWRRTKDGPRGRRFGRLVRYHVDDVDRWARTGNSEPSLHKPIIAAYRDGINLVFWCLYCKEEHRHGVCGNKTGCVASKNSYGEIPCTCPRGEGDGHREAHCINTESPYRNGGYLLVEVTRQQHDTVVCHLGAYV